jgi:hypothetical protein
MQRIVRAPKFLFIQYPRQRVEAGAADFGRQIGSIETGRDGFCLERVTQSGAQHARLFNFLLVRIEFIDDEIPRRLDDHLLLFIQCEIHGSPDVECFGMAIDGYGLTVHHPGSGRGEE